MSESFLSSPSNIKIELDGKMYPQSFPNEMAPTRYFDPNYHSNWQTSVLQDQNEPTREGTFVKVGMILKEFREFRKWVEIKIDHLLYDNEKMEKFNRILLDDYLKMDKKLNQMQKPLFRVFANLEKFRESSSNSQQKEMETQFTDFDTKDGRSVPLKRMRTESPVDPPFVNKRNNEIPFIDSIKGEKISIEKDQPFPLKGPYPIYTSKKGKTVYLDNGKTLTRKQANSIYGKILIECLSNSKPHYIMNNE